MRGSRSGASCWVNVGWWRPAAAFPAAERSRRRVGGAPESTRMPSGPGSIGCRREWCKLSSWACRVVPGCSSAIARRIAGKRVGSACGAAFAIVWSPYDTRLTRLRNRGDRHKYSSASPGPSLGRKSKLRILLSDVNSRTLRLEQMRSVRAQLPVKAEFFVFCSRPTRFAGACRTCPRKVCLERHRIRLTDYEVARSLASAIKRP